MSPTLRILHLEDDPVDAELVAATLASDGLACEIVCVASRTQFESALDGTFDLILSDYSLPSFDGVTAQSIALERRPDLPFVFVSGTMGEEVAIERLKAGATDYVLKQRLARLPSAVRRALDEARERREHREDEAELARLHAELEQRVADRTAELREANAFLDSIVENLPHMIFVKDASDLRFVRLNRAGEDLLGLRREDVLGRTDHDFLPRLIADGFVVQDRNVLDTRQTLDIPEEILPMRNGAARVMHTKKIPIGDTAGRPQYLLGISEDITARRIAEEEVRLARLEAERANRAKSEFLSRMSHDLRTPLNAILGFAQILEMDVATPHEADSVRQILNGGMHLLDLINEILDIASIEAGRLSLSPESLSVSEMVGLVLDLLRPLADAREIEMRVDPSVCDDLYVRADRQRLKQILVNLIGNAVKYNRTRGSVVIACAETDKSVRISVKDTGPGIAAEKIPLLFQPFERLGAESGPVEGTGLGLAVAKGLVEAMHGHLVVDSREGVGATFSFALPRTAAPAIAAPIADLPRGDARQDADVEGTILYIEDNESNVRLLERLLTRRPGIRLLSAKTGEDGIAAAQRERPDLILLDLHLPDVSGEDVLARLKGDPRTHAISVAVLSADVIPGQPDRLRAAGAVAYLSKPVDVGRLLRLIDRRLVS